MKRALIAIALLCILTTGASAWLGLGNHMGRLGVSPKSGGAAVQPNGSIWMVDGVSFILQTDAASQICRAGGC